MQRHDVSSSRIKSIGYDIKTKTLEIEFFVLGIYQYVGVSPKTYETFLSDSVKSKGRFFDGVIKDKFLCRKIS
ncbi:KTSC domain-containing protein [Kluyvera genomosp. 1]|uniref:KTSC domain-containing protein n=1 Tax=Kluyvera genomosp. 1 TaxID=2774053 RepID=UPI00069148C2|nr:KTSC domain-containing protein [Kluyvera genomosp. 1]